MNDRVSINIALAAEGERLVAQMIEAARVVDQLRKLVPSVPAGREELR